jgi:hypothetical protein
VNESRFSSLTITLDALLGVTSQKAICYLHKYLDVQFTDLVTGWILKCGDGVVLDKAIINTFHMISLRSVAF